MGKTIYDILDEVVASMRGHFAYTSIEHIDVSHWKINSPKKIEAFSIDDYVDIFPDDTSGRVVEVSDNYIIIETTVNIVSDNGVIYNNMPLFDYEYFDYEARKLAEKNTNIEKLKKFPLIFLDVNFSEKRTKQFRSISPVVYIIGKTNESWDMRTRNEKSFPRLREIFELFFEKIKNSKYTYDIGSYTYQELPYRTNNLNAIVDAIEIKFDEIKIINCNQ